ncbi:MAG: DNA-directed RNA polymerase subunit H [Candidatus Hodarchaeales archaeon]|jgi:DNA-directed RNA polymerase subunit H
MVSGRILRVVDGAKSILETREFSLKEVIEREEENVVDVLGERPSEKGKKERAIIRIPEKEVVGVKILRDFQKFLEDEKEKFHTAILLALKKYTHYTRKEALEANIEIFPVSFPFFNLFSHELVPRHEFATEEEKQQLIEKYSIELDRLPKIASEDPAAQMLGAKPGDLLKVQRTSPTAGEFIAYRYVVP